LVTGIAIFLVAALDVINSRIKPQFVGDSIVTRVRIADFPQRHSLNVSLVIETIGNPRVPRRVRVSWHKPPAVIRFGDIWQLELRLRRPRGSSNPGTFDYEAWLFRDGVGAIGYVVGGRRNVLLRSAELRMTERLRQRVVDRLTMLITDTDRAAVLAAISVGARHLISPEQWRRYALTGTSHLMAISGLHVGLAAAGGYFLVSLFAAVSCRRRNQHVVATIAAAVIAAGYAVLSGLAVPAQRASLMISLAAIAILMRRQVMPVALVATVCVCIVLVSPLATLAPGFKLSFAAVLVLIWLARRYRTKSETRRPQWPWQVLRQLAAVQAMLLFGLLPLTVALFNRIAFAAPLVNLLAVPIFSIVTVPFTLTGIVLDGALRPAGDKALFAAAFSLDVIELLITAAARIPGADFTTPRIAGPAWIYVVLPLAWVVLPPGWPCRRIAYLAVVALALYQPPRPAAGCADIDVLDIGQGLAVVVTTRRHAVVFDTGPAYRGGGSAAATSLLPFLGYRSINRIDKLVISHADLDHAGGVAAIRANVDVLDILTGEPLPGLESAARRCVAGDSWRYDGVQFDFVHPSTELKYQGNDASCILMISSGEHRLLLTGDIEGPVEEELLRNGSISKVDAVIVPHHGSRTSSSLPFVRALSPSLAIVSASYGNRWGFPKQDVVARWQAVGARVLATSTSGAIGMRLCAAGGLVSVTRQRATQRRIWHE
ncbi:MAG: DNA internalization-related competence protein ComEC/Rec2, partial [Gammaproteobacteria bacterium]|nr:DNA internalization-related competence protein ComEC/Rec2 [Gammaproteobacteria bacterium]